MAPLAFGILLTPCQSLDIIGPIDILGSVSRPGIENAIQSFNLPVKHLLDGAPDVTFHHISHDLSPVSLTAGVSVVPTTTCDTCPPLDCLLVGGTDFNRYKLPQRFAEFLRDHVAKGKTLFTTCTGAWTVAESGVLDGKKATINRVFLKQAKVDLPKVNWQDEGQWVVDGQIWTAGGAVAGMDMMAGWVVEEFGIELATYGLEGLDFEPRDIHGDAHVVIPKQRGANKSSKATWV